MPSAVTCARHPQGPSFVTACPKVRACPQGFLLVGLQEPYPDRDFCGSCSISRFAESPHFHRKRKHLCNAAATKKTAPLLSYWKDVDKNVRGEGKGNPEGWAGGCRERNRTRCRCCSASQGSCCPMQRHGARIFCSFPYLKAVSGNSTAGESTLLRKHSIRQIASGWVRSSP